MGQTSRTEEQQFWVEEDGDTCRVVIPVRPSPLAILRPIPSFCLVSLPAVITTLFLVNVIRATPGKPDNLFLLVLIAILLALYFLLLVGLFLRALLWELIGQEIIEVTPTRLRIERQISGRWIARAQQVALSEIQDVLILPGAISHYRVGAIPIVNAFKRERLNAIAFLAHDERYYIGDGLHEEDARRLYNWVQRQLLTQTHIEADKPRRGDIR